MAGPPQTLRRQPREASGSRGEAWSRLARPCGVSPLRGTAAAVGAQFSHLRPSSGAAGWRGAPGDPQAIGAPPRPGLQPRLPGTHRPSRPRPPTSSEAASSRCPRPGVPATEPRPGPLPPPPPQSPLARARQRAHLRGAPSRPPPARSAAPAKAPTRSLCSPGDPGPPSPRSNGGGGSDSRKPGGGDGEGGTRRRGPRTALWDPESHRPFRARKPAGVGLQVPAGRERGAGLTCAPRGSLGPRVRLPEGLDCVSRQAARRGGRGTWSLSRRAFRASPSLALCVCWRLQGVVSDVTAAARRFPWALPCAALVRAGQ